MKNIKKVIIRWALRQLKKEVKKNPKIDYENLSKYGVQDILKNENTGEDMFLCKGAMDKEME